MKIFENQLNWKLENFDKIAPLLTIRNLSTFFPDLGRKFNTKLDQLLKLHV
jgi:hypothetical protein